MQLLRGILAATATIITTIISIILYNNSSNNLQQILKFLLKLLLQLTSHHSNSNSHNSKLIIFPAIIRFLAIQIAIISSKTKRFYHQSALRILELQQPINLVHLKHPMMLRRLQNPSIDTGRSTIVTLTPTKRLTAICTLETLRDSCRYGTSPIFSTRDRSSLSRTKKRNKASNCGEKIS